MKPKNLADYKDTIHHNNAKGISGSNDDCNKTNIIRRLHRAWHVLFGILPPHLCIKFMLKLGCEPLEDHIKDQIIKILTPENPESLYKPKSIINKTVFIKECEKGNWVEYQNYSYKNIKGRKKN